MKVIGHVKAALPLFQKAGISDSRDGGFIVLCGDVSRLKQQEWSLRQSNLLLDAALENMSQGLCFFDADHRLIVCNDRFVEMYGLPSGRVGPGTPLTEIVIPTHNGVPEFSV